MIFFFLTEYYYFIQSAQLTTSAAMPTRMRSARSATATTGGTDQQLVVQATEGLVVRHAISLCPLEPQKPNEGLFGRTAQRFDPRCRLDESVFTLNTQVSLLRSRELIREEKKLFLPTTKVEARLSYL